MGIAFPPWLRIPGFLTHSREPKGRYKDFVGWGIASGGYIKTRGGRVVQRYGSWEAYGVRDHRLYHVQMREVEP